MLFCRTCKKYCSERAGTILEQARLPTEKIISILKHIREGCGIRATARLVSVRPDTVSRYVRIAGDHAQKLHDELVTFSPPNF